MVGRIRVEAWRLRKGFYEVSLFLPYRIKSGKYLYHSEMINDGYYINIFRLNANSKKDAVYKIVKLYL